MKYFQLIFPLMMVIDALDDEKIDASKLNLALSNLLVSAATVKLLKMDRAQYIISKLEKLSRVFMSDGAMSLPVDAGTGSAARIG